MFRVSVIFLAVIASILAEDQGEKTDDESLHINKCCKSMFMNPDFEAIYDECHEDTFMAPSDIAMCMATKKGIVTPDGKLDVAKVNNYIEDEFKTDPDLIKAIKKACVEGDASKYKLYPHDDEIANFLYCEIYQQIMTCPDTSEDVPCDGEVYKLKKIE